MNIRRKLQREAKADLQTLQTQEDAAFLRRAAAEASFAAAQRRKKRLRIFAAVGAMCAVCFVTLAVGLPQWAGAPRSEGLNDMAGAAPDAVSPAPSEPSAPAGEDGWRDAARALGFFIGAEGWTCIGEDLGDGASYAVVCLRGEEELTVRFPVTEPLSGGSKMPAGAFTLVYEEENGALEKKANGELSCPEVPAGDKGNRFSALNAMSLYLGMKDDERLKDSMLKYAADDRIVEKLFPLME